jgi:hypothetical protein
MRELSGGLIILHIVKVRNIYFGVIRIDGSNSGYWIVYPHGARGTPQAFAPSESA